MADEETQTTMPEPNKNEIVCPLSLKIGVVQNYRCTWRGRNGEWESRPVKGPDKWADDFLKMLHEELDQPGSKALHFSHEEGMEARKRAIELVNAGEVKAPKRGWDEKFGPQGGTPVDDLKQQYPELYESKARAKKEDTTQREDLDREMEAADTSDILTREEVEDIEAESDGEGAYSRSSDEVEAFAAEATVAEAARVLEMQAKADFEYEIVIEPEGPPTMLHVDCFRASVDEEGETRKKMWFRVNHPTTNKIVWLPEGTTQIDGVTIELKVR